LEPIRSNQKRQKRQAHSKSFASATGVCGPRASVVKCGSPFCRFSFGSPPRQVAMIDF